MVILRSMIWWTICIENLQKLRVYSVEDGIDIESSCIAKTLFRCGKCLMESSSSPDDMYGDQNLKDAFEQ